MTNIGNRNIIYKGKSYAEHNDNINFLDWSYNLLENYIHYKDDLDINIFKPLLRPENNIESILILYSDQSKLNTRTNQDTIYEAKIIKQILIDKYQYKDKDIELLPIKVKVVDNGALMKDYRSKLIQIRRREFSKLIICDAGGTAQQKMALKIMAEYILENNQYEIKYTEDNNIVSDVSINEYRKILDDEQSIKLMHHGQFYEALRILGFENLNQSSSDVKINLLKYLHFRFNNNPIKAKEAISRAVNVKMPPLVLNYINRCADSDLIELSDYFGTPIFILLIDKFYKVLFYRSIHLYSECILALSQFYEFLFSESVKRIDPIYNFGQNITRGHSDEQIQNLNEFISQSYPDLIGHRADIRSTNTQLLICKKTGPLSIQNMACLLSPYIEFTDNTINTQTINPIRNKIAHEGLYLSKLDFENSKQIVCLISGLQELLKLTNQNLFKDICNYIEDKIRS